MPGGGGGGGGRGMNGKGLFGVGLGLLVMVQGQLLNVKVVGSMMLNVILFTQKIVGACRNRMVSSLWSSFLYPYLYTL